MGTLRTWGNLFLLEIGNFKWYGKLLEGQYPAWRSVIPRAEALNYSITLDDPAAVIDWVKNIPSQKTTNGVEFNVTPHGVTLVSCIQTEYQLSTAATVTGVTPRAVLTLDREILLRMLLQGSPRGDNFGGWETIILVMCCLIIPNAIIRKKH